MNAFNSEPMYDVRVRHGLVQYKSEEKDYRSENLLRKNGITTNGPIFEGEIEEIEKFLTPTKKL